MTRIDAKRLWLKNRHMPTWRILKSLIEDGTPIRPSMIVYSINNFKTTAHSEPCACTLCAMGVPVTQKQV